MLKSKMETMVLIYEDVIDALCSHLKTWEDEDNFDIEAIMYDLRKLRRCALEEKGVIKRDAV